MDKITFDYSFSDELCIGETTEAITYLDIKTYINSLEFFPDLSIDIFALDASLKDSGEYSLFTCGCGVAECAGIWKNPNVKIEKDKIIWNIYQPEAHTFIFDKNELTTSINNLKKNLLKEKTIEEWEDIEYTSCSPCIVEFLEDK